MSAKKPTQAALDFYKRLNDFSFGGRHFDPRYVFPYKHVISLEEAGLVIVKKINFDVWWVQRVDRCRDH